MTLAELNKKALSLPLEPGCYIMRNKKNEIIYIGKAKKLKNRVHSYFMPGANHQPKVAKMVSQVEDFDVIVTDSEYEALVLECSLIKQNNPKYNILLKDDKGFCYIRVTDEAYPRISVSLQRYEDGSRYIGPYYNSFALKQMVEQANLAFILPTCSKKFPKEFGKERPCLNAHIGRCMALCTGKIGREEYNRSVEDALTLLTKGTKEILSKLTEDMQQASDALEFERAARIRDTIAAIRKGEAGQKVIKNKEDEELDVFAFAGNERCVCAVVLRFRDGKLSDKDEQLLQDTSDIAEAREEFIAHYYIQGGDIPKKIFVDDAFEGMDLVERMLSGQRGRAVHISVPKRGENLSLVAMAYNNAAERLKREAGRKTRDEAALGELANLLGLSHLPVRMEAYDISNYGEEAVAGMTVFISGVPRKADYRRFIIKTVAGVDDYASMRETLQRRAARLEAGSPGFARKPDILLIDGGRGHLAAAMDAVAGTALADVPMFGMVKDDKHRTRGIVSKDGELNVALHKSAFQLVTKIQNETHRFTVDYQRTRHSKSAFRSTLTQIEGIGEKRAKELMKHFKTLERVQNASVEELQAAPGMTLAAAQAVYAFYNA